LPICYERAGVPKLGARTMPCIGQNRPPGYRRGDRRPEEVPSAKKAQDASGHKLESGGKAPEKRLELVGPRTSVEHSRSASSDGTAKAMIVCHEACRILHLRGPLSRKNREAASSDWDGPPTTRRGALKVGMTRFGSDPADVASAQFATSRGGEALANRFPPSGDPRKRVQGRDRARHVAPRPFDAPEPPEPPANTMYPSTSPTCAGTG